MVILPWLAGCSDSCEIAGEPCVFRSAVGRDGESGFEFRFSEAREPACTDPDTGWCIVAIGGTGEPGTLRVGAWSDDPATTVAGWLRREGCAPPLQNDQDWWPLASVDDDAGLELVAGHKILAVFGFADPATGAVVGHLDARVRFRDCSVE